MVKYISLEGVGGCSVSNSLRKFKQPAYPYDWNATTQQSVIRSFNNFGNLFIFESKYLYSSYILRSPNNDANTVHDFYNFENEKKNVIDKYNRRFSRPKNTIENDDDYILLVRHMFAGIEYGDCCTSVINSPNIHF